MAVPVIFQKFLENLAEGVHDFEVDQLTVALTAAANPPDTINNAVLADLTEISYTNLSSRNITTTSSSQTSGLYKLVLANLTLSASGGSVATFRHIVIYNSTATVGSPPSNPLIAAIDTGQDTTLADTQTFPINFDQTNGLLDLTTA